MHLLHCLVFYAAISRFELVTQHIPGVLNTAEDAISHNKISLFVYLIPQIPHITIMQAIIKLLSMKRPDWGLQSCTGAFAHSLTRESQKPQNQCTDQDGNGTYFSTKFNPTSTVTHRGGHLLVRSWGLPAHTSV